MTASNTLSRPEDIWEAILSRQPDLIQAAFASLDETEQATVLTHLRRMSIEEGWHPEHRQSARSALSTLGGESP